MMAADQCPACGGADRRMRHQSVAFTIWQCQNCDLGYCDPLPDQAQLERAYTDAYKGATTGYFSKVDRKLARSRGRMAQLAKMVSKKQGQTGRFLDIGCNGGFMVQAAIEKGFEAYGLDPDPVSIAFAREHYPNGRFTHAFAESYRDHNGLDPNMRFDAIYCSEVIEHAPDPNRFAASLADLAAPGAIVYLTTPDAGHFFVPADFSKWDAYCPPDHCLYFTRTSLSRLLSAHGFDIIGFRWAIKPGIKLFARRKP
jgi:2-polyprenyl-3-methyl-5-hydroxy-6-metoxy-1,4-benzoquinol methylase